ncbi:response regulator, partial [Streptomyces sp. SID5914]
MTTVLIQDDQTLQRVGLRILIEAQPDLTVIGEATTGAEVVRKTAELRPNVVLMDVRTPEAEGIEAICHIAESGGLSRVMVVTTFDLDEYTSAALRAGASGFLLKDARPEELIAGIHAVAAGDAFISGGLTRRLLDAFREQTSDAALVPEPELIALTERERDVLLGIASGWTNAEIGERLFIAETTVKS